MKRKLALKKVTIATLNQNELKRLKGGATAYCSPTSMEGDCPTRVTCDCTVGCTGGCTGGYTSDCGPQDPV